MRRKPQTVLIINNFEKIYVNTSQLEQWSILSNVPNYVQYNRHPIGYYQLDVMALEPMNHKSTYKWLEKDDSQLIDLDFGDKSEKLKGEYLHVYNEVRLEILYTKMF